MIENTVAFSSKQLFISNPQNYGAKSVGKFPKEVVNASFLQCLAYIILGQADDLGTTNLKILLNQSKKNLVKHSKYDSIVPPHIYSQKP